MTDYVIFADSACDIDPEILKSWGIKSKDMVVRFEGEEKEYMSYDLDAEEFYDEMKNGKIAKTAAINSEEFKDMFKSALDEGKDAIYIGFSSGLSCTYNTARLAVDELREEYPDRKIYKADSRCASGGYGLLLYLVAKQKQAGATIDDIRNYVYENRLNICHWFTVDDLSYLKRGGRISATTALVGNVLNIKPVLHMDDEGHLVNVTKVRGRKASIKAMAEKYDELAINKEDGIVYISHGGCENDAKYLKTVLEENYRANVELITPIGPVIGAHSGPGTLAVFFVGSER